MGRFLNALARWLVGLMLAYNLLVTLLDGGMGDYVERRPAIVEELEVQDPANLPVRVVFEDEPTRAQDGIGSSFAIGDGTLFATARHVVGRCDSVLFVERNRIVGQAARVLLHRHADVAVVVGSVTGEPLPVATPGRSGMAGYHYGFPQGQRVSVRSQLLGVIGTRTEGDWVGNEPMGVWVEQDRVPALNGTLGGMSGGPVLNDAGAVVGITVREDRRQGRILTAHPVTLAALLGQPAVPGGRNPPALDPARFAGAEAALVGGGRVRQLVCDVNAD